MEIAASGPRRRGMIAELVAKRAAAAPQRTAFLDGTSGARVTWSDIAATTRRVQRSLPGGSRPPRLGIHVQQPEVFCRTYLAALAAGCEVAPLDPRAPAEELGRQVEALTLSDVVTDGLDTSEALTDLAGAVTLRDTDGVVAVGAPPPARSARTAAPGAPAPALLMTTSGTTGRPKLVPLSEAQLLHVAGALAEHHRLGPDERGYCPLPLFHINAQVVGILSTLVSGGSLVVERRFRRHQTWQAVQHSGATWLNLVPAVIAALEADGAPGIDVTSIRFARSASSPLPDAVRHRFEQQTGIGILETYGMTEAASQITANPLDPARRRPGSVGLPVGVELRITDADADPAEPAAVVPAGVLGMVEIRGPGVISAYLQPGPTGARLPALDRDGWLRTGDLGSLDADGFVTLSGRKDDVINRGGEKLHPRQVEEVLLRDRRVSAAAVVGRPHPSLGAEPVAFVTADSVAPTARATLRADLDRLCAEALSRYKRPVEIVVVDVLPTGTTGKVARRKLVDLAALGAAGA